MHQVRMLYVGRLRRHTFGGGILWLAQLVKLFLEYAWPSHQAVGMFVLALPLTAAMSSTATARAALLNAISPLERGFKADKQQRLVVESAIKALAASTSLRALPDISGDWELIYTDAPDILGLDAQAGPLATCTRIGQQISEADGEAAWSECASSQQPARPLTAPEPCPLALTTLWAREERALAAWVPERACPMACARVSAELRRLSPPALTDADLHCRSPPRYDLQRDRVRASRVGGQPHRAGQG
jgi:hypothetical protein